jgi:hypothetical protein
MKTLVLTCLLGLFSILSVTAQNHSFDRLFDRYADKDGFLTLKFSNLPSDMLSDSDKDPDFRISALKILTVQDENLNSKLNFYKEIIPQVNRKDYEELMTVKHNGEKAILLCKKDNKRITEVLFVSGGKKNIMVEISGSMSLNQAKKITANISEDDEDSN